MSSEIKKAIIPIAGLGTRFLPQSIAVPKEFFPLVDKPIVQYLVEEMKASGIKEIIFVVNPEQKAIQKYFKKHADLEKLLVKRKKEKALKDLKEFENMFEGMTISFVAQKEPLGDGHAILQASKLAGKEPFAVSFGDDLIYSDEPAISQLTNIFQTCNAPIVALKSVPKNKLSAYGVVAVEKIAHNLYKIKRIVEKPEEGKAPSDLVIVGKYVLTPDVFGYLKKAKPSKKGEIILAEVFDQMLQEGKTIYGYEVKGEWLECGDKLKWLKSFFYLALKNPNFKEELKQYLKTIK